MAENSRKNEFFERESIAIIAITTSSSIRVKQKCFTPPWRKESLFFIIIISYVIFFGVKNKMIFLHLCCILYGDKFFAVSIQPFCFPVFLAFF